ncbi:MAG: nucleotidyl transferase AbiEii/AbiGii toxin family protein [Cyclobacteriaceae bacterium]|nr:nucleotidyl transferase AbiEii/AbiGii toxin family protein [Cyclobacteriaceae bacterium]
MTEFDQNVLAFIRACGDRDVKMLMVGGTAVNFHGYKRHSADVDFWIDISEENLMNLKAALLDIGFEFEQFPEEVYKARQNISVKISPEMELELITAFNLDKSFNEAYRSSEVVTIDDTCSYRVIGLDDLISNKQRSARPKDLLDIQVLKQIHH